MSGTTHSAAAASRVALGLAAAGLAALLVVLEPTALAGSTSAKQARVDQTAVTSKQQAREAYAKLPLSFVPNAGQTDRRVRYSAQAGGASFYFTQKAAVFSFAKGKKGSVLRLAFLGANPAATIEGRRLAPGRVNYLIGNDPAKWHTNLPTYGEVVYRDLWPGIDMVFRGSGGRLKYEFHVAPGASVRDIRLAYRGADGLSLDRRGNLVLRTALGTLEDSRPLSYQQIGAKRAAVRSRFALGGGSAYGFAVAAYDRRLPLIVDPGLQYSTYLGGSGDDRGSAIAVEAGSAYVTGTTNSPTNSFPTTLGAWDTSLNSGLSDAYVTKLDATGSALLYSTYLGGSGEEQGFGIAVETGSAYVTGSTTGSFPTTLGAFDTSFNGGVFDAFVTKLDATGSALLYSTYLGGSAVDEGSAIAVEAGSAYVTGRTNSPTNSFPTTLLAFDTSFNGVLDAFVTKLNTNASGAASLLYSTYLGGSGNDQGFGIAVEAGSAYVTGRTNSPTNSFPTTPGAFDTSFNGGFFDAFVTRLDATGAAPLYSTYLGGSGDDQGFGIAVETGSAYVTGLTASPTTSFPTTLLAFDTSFDGVLDAFVTKLNTNASGTASLLYSTYLGGSGNDQGFGIVVEAGSAYVTGRTNSPTNSFPTTLGAWDTSFNGGLSDAFVTKLDATGSALLYSTYLGGSGEEQGFAIAVETGSAYVTGRTTGSFPTTLGAWDTSFNGGLSDAFVTKLDMVAAVPAKLTLSPAFATNPVETSHTVTATVTDAAGQQPVPNIDVHFTVTGSVNTTDQCTTNGTGQCSITYSGPTAPGGDAITAYADTNNNQVQDSTTVPPEPTGAATKTWIPATSGCPPNGGDDDEDDDGLEDNDERFLGTLLGVTDSDGDGREDGNDDSDDDGEDDEDEDDGTDDECPNDSDGDGEDDEDEDDDDDEDDD